MPESYQLADGDEQTNDDFPLEELAILLERDENSPAGGDDDFFDFDEPEPLADYDTALRQAIYVIEDDGDLRWELRINRLVASVEKATDSQRCQISKLLREFTNYRLRSWLPWLSKQVWTGRNLLLFLRFRAQWDDNPRWWESTFWDWLFQCWRPTWNRYNLSRDDTFALIEQRSYCEPANIIGETWLADWEGSALWKYGFLSFAGFALFRSSFRDGEDWRLYIDWHTTIDSGDEDSVDEPGANRSPLRSTLPLWFIYQDWYAPGEWHDNLGC